MTPSEYVSALYTHLLKRPPEPGAVKYWSELIQDGLNPMDVFHAFVVSAEYRRKHGEVDDHGLESLVLRAAREVLRKRPLFVVDVGAQILEWEEHVYQPLLAAGLLCDIVGFDPLADRLRERAEKERDTRLTLLPFAIGDGKSHTLHINNDDGTSSLYPLNPAAIQNLEGLERLRTIGTETVTTRRLDDVLPPRAVDFLKLDIQGFELRALENATETLFRTAVVHCETEFYPLYAGQPLFPQVHSYLASRGFEFIDLVKESRVAPSVPSGCKGPERLVFADAVFFRKAKPNEHELLLVQALVALLVYKKTALAESLLLRYDPNYAHELSSQAAD